MHWLGLDPGQRGACLLLSPDAKPVLLWSWRPRTSYGAVLFEIYALHVNGESRKVIVPTLHRVGLCIQTVLAAHNIPRFGLAVEAPYISRVNPAVGITVAVQTGTLAGPLEEHIHGEIVMVKAEEWRRSLLNLPIATKRDAAKAASLAKMPIRIPGMAALLERMAASQGATIESLDHVTDAAGVAEYGHLRLWEQRDADRKKRRAKRRDSKNL